ncbi:hypothetical protein OC861_001087 [Tilletia horrida]|nr:hypothetical protein OC861_001087 [Tilletia horrida]
MHAHHPHLQQDPFVVHPTFRADADNSGDVLIIVQDVDFYVHRDLLWFASSFFRDLLQENWAEGHLADQDEPPQHGSLATETATTALERAAQAIAQEEAEELQLQLRQHQEQQAQPERESASTGPGPHDTVTQHHEVTTDEATPNDASSKEGIKTNDQSTDSGTSPTPVATENTAAISTTRDSSSSAGIALSPLISQSKRASYHTAQIALDEPSPTPSEHNPTGNTSGEATSSTTSRQQTQAQFLLSPTSRSETLPSRSASREGQVISPALSLQNLQLLETPPGSPIRPSRHITATIAGTIHMTSSVSNANLAAQPPIPSASSSPSPDRFHRSGSTPATAVAATIRHRPISKPRGVIVSVLRLTEESPSTFQSFLSACYPHLRLSVTWRNIGSLMLFSDKYGVQPALLYDPCRMFLEASLTGNPIEAMRLAEQFGLQGVFKEASKHVLDLYAVWSSAELSVLSKETLLKLERKRSWFLERLLKLSVANPQRDYECQPHCPNPQLCAEALQARWTAAYNTAFRFGPPQPTLVWRHLRELEGATGASSTTLAGSNNGPGGAGGGSSSSSGSGQTPLPLALTACENSARNWVQTRFDRMFELGLAAGPRARSQFLYILLDDSVLAKKAIRRRIRADQLLPAPGTAAGAAAPAGSGSVGTPPADVGGLGLPTPSASSNLVGGSLGSTHRGGGGGGFPVGSLLLSGGSTGGGGTGYQRRFFSDLSSSSTVGGLAGHSSTTLDLSQV